MRKWMRLLHRKDTMSEPAPEAPAGPDEENERLPEEEVVEVVEEPAAGSSEAEPEE